MYHYFSSTFKVALYFLLLVCVFPLSSLAQLPLHLQFQQLTDSLYNANPAVSGIVVSVQTLDSSQDWNYAVGYAERDGKTPLLDAHPVLIASNTKTYVAAAILKLVEQNALALDNTIGTLLYPETSAAMIRAGYQPDSITLTHLLSHTSGIMDYVNDAYFDKVHSNPQHAWTRQEQYDLAFNEMGVRVLPGDTFMYADINYLLLSEVMEVALQKPFYTAIRKLLRFEHHGLHASWFTQLEPVPEDVLPLAHQYWGEREWDSYHLNPSWDLYGGGGMVATATDLAQFFKLLYEGKLIEDTSLLNAMCTPPFSELNTNYGLGIRNIKMAGLSAYYHGGFWGTDALYIPALNTAIAIFIFERDERAVSAILCRELVERIKAESRR
jgi:D-alanyl-D-alanine carboxypeptidase